MNWIQDIGCALIGVALIYWARTLSIRYNASTTRLRERHPGLASPPTPEWRQRHTETMTVIIRTGGVFFILYSILTLLAIVVQSQIENIYSS